MITEEEIRKLPDDPDIAFVQYESIIRERMLDEQDDRTDEAERQYIAYALAFIDEYNINIDIDKDAPDENDSFWKYYKGFIKSIDYYKARIMVRTYRSGSSTIAIAISLSNDYRSQIHDHLAAIRKIVTAVEMEETRREALFSKINTLAREVDRERTRLEVFTAMFLDVTQAIGEGAENLEPLLKRIERLAAIFGKAKAEADREEIGPPPKKKLITDSSKARETDSPEDETPF